MANIFLISDTHWDHANILNFTGFDSQPLRVFKDVNHMNEYMVERWNAVIKPEDHVYHLGDVAIKDKGIGYLKRCNGRKRLVLGNHDYPKMKLYTPYFEKIFATRLLDKLLLSHIPVHPLSLGKAIANIHGHVHRNVRDDHFGKQYINVSVEVIDYTPIALEDVLQLVKKRLNA